MEGEEQCQSSKGELQPVELRWSRLCWLGPCRSLPPWQGTEEPFFSKNCAWYQMCQLVTLQAEHVSGPVGTKLWKLLGFPSFHASFWKEMVWGAKESCQVRHCLPGKPVSREQNLSCGAGGWLYRAAELWDCVLPRQKWYRSRVLLSSFWGESKKGMEGKNIALGMAVG